MKVETKHEKDEVLIYPRIPSQVAEEIRKLAEKANMSQNAVINVALRKGLPRAEEALMSC